MAEEEKVEGQQPVKPDEQKKDVPAGAGKAPAEASKPAATEKKDAPSGDGKAPAEGSEPAAAEKKDSEPASAAEIMADVTPAAPVAAKPQGKKRGLGRVGPLGVAHVKSTFNNTIVSIADLQGNVVTWSSAGRAGFKGSRKSTAYAASLVGQDVARQAGSKGIREVEVRVQGPGAGREPAVRALQSSGLDITVIKDVTPIPHNGCRPRKRRRV